MNMYWTEDLQSLWLVALAGALGAVIGLEREWAGKPAGLRTHVFVCSGAALLMILGQLVLDDFTSRNSQTAVMADPIRVIQAIIIGIGFLGAGTIIHESGERVEGLTTASSIFLTAGIGVAVGIKHLVLAAGTSIFALLVLLLMGWLENHLRWRRSPDRQRNK